MKKYKIYDLMEGKDVVGYADTLQEVKKLSREWFKDTDGDCCLVYAELNPKTGKYWFSQYKEVKY